MQKNSTGPKPKTEPMSSTEARRRREAAIAQTRELQLRVMEGKLLSHDSVIRVWSEAYTRLKTSLLAIPDRTAAALAGKPEAECRRIIRREIEVALESISRKPI